MTHQRKKPQTVLHLTIVFIPDPPCRINSGKCSCDKEPTRWPWQVILNKLFCRYASRRQREMLFGFIGDEEMTKSRSYGLLGRCLDYHHHHFFSVASWKHTWICGKRNDPTMLKRLAAVCRLTTFSVVVKQFSKHKSERKLP